MRKGCCGSDTQVLIEAGDGIEVTGSGAATNPYRISADLPDFSQSITVRDTTSLNLVLFGSGTVADPFTLQGDVKARLLDLADVDDPAGPAVGESPVWVGVGAAGHWEFSTLPPAPAGAVNATGGLSGLGTAPDPLKVEVSGTWGVAPLDTLGSDSTVGLEVYLDSAGELRARPPAVTAVTWASITGKPSSFTPAPHNHPASQITDPQNINAGKLNGITIFSQSSTPTAKAVGDLWAVG